jgi:hypothetical protein
MNINIVTGFVVGGMLLLSLLVLNYRVSRNSGMVTLTEMTRQQMDAIARTADADLRRIGQAGGGFPITHASANRLVFVTSFDGLSASTVEWHYDTNDPVADSPNPDDHMLYRIADGDSTKIRMGVTDFTFSYFNAAGNPTAVLTDIRRIRLQVIVESEGAFGDEYARSYWETEISPRRLQ